MLISLRCYEVGPNTISKWISYNHPCIKRMCHNDEWPAVMYTYSSPRNSIKALEEFLLPPQRRGSFEKTHPFFRGGKFSGGVEKQNRCKIAMFEARRYIFQALILSICIWVFGSVSRIWLAVFIGSTPHLDDVFSRILQISNCELSVFLIPPPELVGGYPPWN